MTSIGVTHAWDVSFAEAQALQKMLSEKIKLAFPRKTIRTVAGADVSFDKYSPILFAGIVVYSFPQLQPLEEEWVAHSVRFPYVPGFLSFREAPPVLAAYKKLQHIPDLMILDGQGIAHPRGLGLASHVGLLLGLPTIGCAKSLLVGEYPPVPETKGAMVPLTYHGKEVGRVVRTRDRVKPVFVSPGHLMDFETASRVILQCCPRYRLPEPTRHAHTLVNRVRREHKGSHAKV